jgi:thioredoxin
METLCTPEKIQNTINMITGGTNQQFENANNDEVSSTQRVSGTNQQLENANDEANQQLEIANINEDILASNKEALKTKIHSIHNFMRNNGYTTVYELMGGIMKWSAANLPLTTDSSVKKVAGMDLASFKELTKGDKIVLVDFYADWCLPCKKMEPFLNEIANEKKEKVTLIRINADEQSELCKSLKIDALPYLQLYKNENLLWEKVGFIDKIGIENEINLVKF